MMSRHSPLLTAGGRTLVMATALLALAACGSSTGGSTEDQGEGATVSSVATDDDGTGTTAATDTTGPETTSTVQATGSTTATGGAATDAQLEQQMQQALTEAEQALAEAEQMVSSIDQELNSAASAAANGG